MELIERYLYEVGRRLPGGQRKDILNELRSSLEDSLDARSEGEPTEDDVVAVLQEMGSPKEVAASYAPEKQYLIGPNLYPIFKLVLGITFVAIIGAQLLAIVVAFFLAGEPVNIEQFLGILNSLPTALGFVVIVFFILDRLDVDF
ncbi:MAG: hypothetical protein R3335_07705, partial [Anaerolineales bacterium]|nr:hypothetical protein [Anaerolineales bacterium]